MTRPFQTLPRRIFLDSCTAQTLRDYGGSIYEGEPIADADRICRVTDGLANVEALRNIFLINERALFEWIVSRGSLREAHAKQDAGHMQWLWDIADHSEVCLQDEGPTAASQALAARLAEPIFGYLSRQDRLLLQEAVTYRCEAFLTMERRLPRNAVSTRTRHRGPDAYRALGHAAALGGLVALVPLRSLQSTDTRTCAGRSADTCGGSARSELAGPSSRVQGEFAAYKAHNRGHTTPLHTGRLWQNPILRLNVFNHLCN
jgi:hypothetical protein